MLRPLACVVLLASVGLLSQAGPGYAQQPSFSFERIGREAGLSHNTVSSIVQDRRGFLWVGTTDGLNRYDGYTFTVFRHDPTDSTSLSNSYIQSLYEDAAGRLWVGTLRGLNRYEPGVAGQADGFVRYLLTPDSLTTEPANVFDMIEDDDGRLWIGTNQGIFRIEPETDQVKRYQPVPPDVSPSSHTQVLSLFVDRSGTLWAPVGASLCRYEPDTDAFRCAHGPPFTTTLFPIYEEADGTLYVAYHSNLHRFDPTTGRLTEPALLASEAKFQRKSWVDRNGTLWLTSDRGLFRYDPATDQKTHVLIDLAEGARLQNQTRALYEDRAGTLWVGTLGGLFRHDPYAKPFLHRAHDPTDPQSLSGNIVMALWEDRTGGLWVGTLGSGLNRFDPQTGLHARYRHQAGVENSLCNNDIWSLFEDAQGTLWIGTDRGLCRFDPGAGSDGRFRSYPLPVDSTWVYPYQPPVNTIRQRRDGTLWVASDAGLYRVDPQTSQAQHYAFPGDLRHVGTQALYLAPDGFLWVGTVDYRFYRFDPGTERFTDYAVLPEREGPISGEGIWAIHQDEEGVFWLGGDIGLTRFDPRSGDRRQFTQREGLPGSIVYGILEDDRHRLWISTNQGLARYEDPLPDHQSFRSYDAGDGLRNVEFNRRAAFKASDGTLYFGGLDGLTAFHPDQIEDNAYVPPVVITQVEKTNPDTTVTIHLNSAEADPLVLGHRDYAVSMAFVALNFTNAQKNQYAYLLEGFDERWVEAGTRRRADYTSLPAGDYVFRVRGSNADGVWNEAGASLPIRVLPPWWRTWWAYLTYVVLTFGSVFGLVWWRSERLRRRTRELEHLVAERTAAVERQKAHIEAQAAKLMELDQMKSRFFANISHEFRTPLTLIRGPVEDLHQGKHGALSEAVLSQLDVTLRNTDRLRQLIDQLLDLSRLEAGKLSLEAAPGDLIVFLRRLVGAFASLAERRDIALRFESEIPSIPLFFDADKLEKVMTNLLSNAFKFTEAGGGITITVEDASAEAEELGTGAFVTIRVADTGVGIPAAQVPHVFDRFYQADPSLTRRHEGTGIGLALVRELVALHGGEVAVESTEDVGTTFTVLLPKGAAHLAEEEIVRERERGGEGERERGGEGEDRGSRV